MKKITLTTFAFLFTILSYSQITLEKTILKDERINFVKIDNEIKYFTFDLKTLVMNIYNSNHSVFKTITLDTNNLGFTYDINDFWIQDFFPVICLSKNVFDTDDELEFLLFLYGNNNTRVMVVNEDGQLLFNEQNKRPHFREDYNPQAPTWIKNTNSGIKMILKDVNSSYNKKYIYSLPGTATLTSANFNRNFIELKAYPNPSSDYINLEYKLPNGVNNGKILVYNLNGKKIKEYNIDNHVSSLQLNSEELSSGTYIYSVVADNYKSKSLKLIIQ